MHVHFDAQDMSLKQIKNFAKLWIKHEDCINRLVPASRRNNRWCKTLLDRFAPLNSNNMTTEEREVEGCREAFRKIDRANSLRDLSRNLTGGDRYHQINFESYFQHGTIEIRIQDSSLDAELVVNWIRLMGALFTAAKNAKNVRPRIANGQTPHFRLKWLFNLTLQGEVRRFWSRRARLIIKQEKTAS